MGENEAASGLYPNSDRCTWSGRAGRPSPFPTSLAVTQWNPWPVWTSCGLGAALGTGHLVGGGGGGGGGGGLSPVPRLYW